MTILTIDFEASCLPRHGRSFPIEVGVAAGDQYRSWVIQPHDRWTGWDWTIEAEALHGLTLEQIAREGLPAARVFAELVDHVQGRRVVADSLLDQYWLDELAAAASAPTPFVIDHIAMLFDEQRADDARIAAAVAYADSLGLTRHRAAGDALWLAALTDDLMRIRGCPLQPLTLLAAPS